MKRKIVAPNPNYDCTPWFLAACVILLHGALLIYDVATHFAPFLHADRGKLRAIAMQQLLEADSWLKVHDAIASSNIIFGEYILQTLLSAVGGPLAVIIFQIGLQLACVLAVYRIAAMVLASNRQSAVAALIYALLPQNIVYTHQFSTEAPAVALLILGYYCFFVYLQNANRVPCLWVAGLMMGLSYAIRPVFLLLHVMLLPFLLLRQTPRAAALAAGRFLIVGFLPLFLWVGFISSATQHLTMGNAASGLGYNLYLRALHITRSLPPEAAQAAEAAYFNGKIIDACTISPTIPGIENCLMPLPRYLSFIVSYPESSIHYYLRDTLTFVAKSGVSKLTIDYFDFIPNAAAIQDRSKGWLTIWEAEGLLAAIKHAAGVSPLVVAVELVGSLLFIIFMFFFMTGMVGITRQYWAARENSARQCVLLLLAGLPIYIFATSLVVESVQSRHRYPGEFAMVIIAVYGAAMIANCGYRRSRSLIKESEDDHNRRAS